MNRTAQTIKNRLSLRPPQAESLEILSKLADELELNNGVGVAGELEKVKALYPTCSDFERDFPSLTFALATGVGKTRLMGAFISYLYVEKGMKNFFILAPGTTIYSKLIDDLSNPSNPKYVFHGISEFAVNKPRIITGDNYAEARTQSLFGESVRIHIFNIQKITSEMRGGREPRIKRLSEYLGDSYFNYLSELDDLVILMDESHHYRAAAGLQAINELKAVLGLELTATPIDTRGNKFKNVVFEYSLAHGLRDGFLKEPAVATRKDFDPTQYNPSELDLIKLEDGIRIHEDTKVSLDIYARDNGVRQVKPFVLVVAKDIAHASELKHLMESDQFFDGRYAGRILQVDSGTTGSSEKDEVIAQLLNVEDPDNEIEVVIHVNMLKEGWDVTNLYTIVPLRASNAQILTEQTIGRGLRLPYGTRTGDEKVDRLTIIAHDRYQAIVDAANDPESLIRKENVIEIDPDELPDRQQVVTTPSVIEEGLNKEKKEIAKITNDEDREKAERSHEVKTILTTAVTEAGASAKSVQDLSSDEIKKTVLENVKRHIESEPQQNLFKDELVRESEEQYESVVQDVTSKIIPIPRILVEQAGEVRTGFNDFELDVSNLNLQPVSEDILVQHLRTNQKSILHGDGTIGVERDTLPNIVVNELINFPEVDYDKSKDLLYKLVESAIGKLGDGRDEDELRNIVLYNNRKIAQYIYAQLKEHFYVEEGEFEAPTIHPFSKIEPHNLSMYTSDKIHQYTETITPTKDIPTKIFGGFTKACHTLYKFHSKAEKDFVTILEDDEDVLKWLRPAHSQFTMYWKQNSRRYEPDLVVETDSVIYMVEIKAENATENEEVKEKARAALKYCGTASEYNAANSGKAWKYVMIPHSRVATNQSLESLATEFEYQSET